MENKLIIALAIIAAGGGVFYYISRKKASNESLKGAIDFNTSTGGPSPSQFTGDGVTAPAGYSLPSANPRMNRGTINTRLAVSPLLDNIVSNVLKR
jgi:hypothetical protein